MGDTCPAFSEQLELNCTDGICVSPWEMKLQKYVDLSSGWGFVYTAVRVSDFFLRHLSFGFRELTVS
jgi:hypothetical protein